MRSGAGWWRSSRGRSVVDHRPEGHRPLHAAGVPGTQADTLRKLAQKIGLDEATFMRTVQDYNAACRVGTLRPHRAGRLPHRGPRAAKTHWARPSTPRPSTPTRAARHHLHLPGPEDRRNRRRALRRRPSPNLFVAGEMMAGNVLGKGYTAGVGMSIGTAFGRIAGTQAARAGGKEPFECRPRLKPLTDRRRARADAWHRQRARVIPIRPALPLTAREGEVARRCRSAMPAATAKASAPCFPR
jgi:hypothetical protein